MRMGPAAGEATADAANSSMLKKAEATARQPMPIDEAVFMAGIQTRDLTLPLAHDPALNGLAGRMTEFDSRCALQRRDFLLITIQQAIDENGCPAKR